ncbi:MAG: AAA-like domain-containing protein [Cyanobacteria bacterium J06639_16]
MGNDSFHDEQFWVVGGSLPPNAPSYIQRQADTALYQQLLAGNLCYVFNSRQMGKSSLRVQTTRRLQAAGVRCGVIDLSEMSSQNATPDQWYADLLRSLVGSFGLFPNHRKWWRDHRELSPIQRLRLFIFEELLDRCEEPIVIFIDEVNCILNLSFSVDDLFDFIRACGKNCSDDNPVYRRLSFALFGVATPSDLISNPNLKPFISDNKDGTIKLEGFTPKEAQPLIPELAKIVNNPEVVLNQILQWTGGQPFLTQKLCALVCRTVQVRFRQKAALSPKDIQQIVSKRVISNWEAQDIPEHLRTIRDRLLHNEQQVGQILCLYKHLLIKKSLPVGDWLDSWPGQVSLQLSGLVIRHRGQLQVRNRIYQAVFDKIWVDQQMAKR